jgi:Rrf2 family iron-sulfur cluster assembly transcriptional regulator
MAARNSGIVLNGISSRPAAASPQDSGRVPLRARGFVAVAAMVEIARSGERPLALREVAGAIGVSLSYLEQLSSGLRSGGLISSSRGPGGGYRLSKPATGISVLDIVVSVERAAIASREKPGAGRSAPTAHADYLRDQMEGFQYLLLQQMSLADVASTSLNRNPFLKRLFKRLQTTRG